LAFSFAHSSGRLPRRGEWDANVTRLFAVQEGKHWRVQIVWPNGGVHYFGRFTSKKDALAWIAAHEWLTLAVQPKIPITESKD
jgi:hypothetical protein